MSNRNCVGCGEPHHKTHFTWVKLRLGDDGFGRIHTEEGFDGNSRQLFFCSCQCRDDRMAKCLVDFQANNKAAGSLSSLPSITWDHTRCRALHTMKMARDYVQSLRSDGVGRHATIQHAETKGCIEARALKLRRVGTTAMRNSPHSRWLIDHVRQAYFEDGFSAAVLHLLIGYHIPEKNHAQGRELMAAAPSRAAFEKSLRAFSDGGGSGSESTDEGEEGIHEARVSFGAPSRLGRAPGYQIKLDLVAVQAELLGGSAASGSDGARGFFSTRAANCAVNSASTSVFDQWDALVLPATLNFAKFGFRRWVLDKYFYYCFADIEPGHLKEQQEFLERLIWGRSMGSCLLLSYACKGEISPQQIGQLMNQRTSDCRNALQVLARLLCCEPDEVLHCLCQLRKLAVALFMDIYPKLPPAEQCLLDARYPGLRDLLTAAQELKQDERARKRARWQR